jgi:hypothetical membrane protein
LSYVVHKKSKFKIDRLKESKVLNIFGVSVFTISIYKSIMATMIASALVNFSHVGLVFIGQFTEGTNVLPKEIETILVFLMMALTTIFF